MPNDTVLSSFTISAKTRSFQLDPQGKGVCNFVIANSGKAALEGRVRLTPTGQNPAVAEWLTIAEPTEQAYKPNEERSYSVNITVPADAPGGTYLFRAEAYSVANPNDDYVGGPEFSFTVLRATPGQPSKGFPLWIPFTALALVVAIAALVAIFVISSKEAAPEESALIDVVGKAEDDARNLLVKAGLAVASKLTPTDKVPVGQVISQDPAFDTAEPKNNVRHAGETINLEIAAKPETVMVPAPDLVGKTLAVARQRIEALKLKVSVVGEKDEGTVDPGSVLEQRPAAGAPLGEGSEVLLTLKAKPLPPGPAVPAWEGTLRVRQTWSGDIDGAKECDNATAKDADFWFRAETATERFLDAKNGASFGFPSEPTLAACRDAIAVAPVTRIVLASLKPGKLVAVRTNLGRYAVVSLEREVGASPATLDLHYQRFFFRLVVPVRDLQVLQPARPLSVAPAQPVHVLAQPTLVKPAVA
ncbi:MAG TPA: PASTA domain-containing protein, partial [Planctomycetota bacterium]|nr:PASTA domain-containing protein [Planctomycetota bacterium]